MNYYVKGMSMGDDEVSSVFDFYLPNYKRNECGILSGMYSLGLGSKIGVFYDLRSMNRKMAVAISYCAGCGLFH